MDGVAADSFGGLVDGFGQRGMRVNRPHQLF